MPDREIAAIRAELSPAFLIDEPERCTTPLVFCSPHSGRIYPEHFLAQSRLDPHTLRKSEDCYIDVLFGSAPAYGAPLISALFPRAFLDVNREPYELDPGLIEAPLPDYANSKSARVIGGLGTIARIVGDGAEIYTHPLPLEAALARIEGLYLPFHAALAGLLARSYRDFGSAILLDCHSMPSNSMAATGQRSRPDIVLGDRFGTSCGREVIEMVQHAFQALGYNVQINRPYAGGYITEHYGRPLIGIEALQIEINRGLYLNETSLETSSGFSALQSDLDKVIAHLIETLSDLAQRPAAAE
ncbi:MAG: N-formylglutamate amidohydrolase [Alphaproteobacteria bacterium]|nr:N-formylglutamate amidohydrolase [Alphaproteobacteria bacterium]